MDGISFAKGLTEFLPFFMELIPDALDIGPVETGLGRFLLKFICSQERRQSGNDAVQQVIMLLALFALL